MRSYTKYYINYIIFIYVMPALGFENVWVSITACYFTKNMHVYCINLGKLEEVLILIV